MAEGFRFGQMDLDTMDFGDKEWQMDMEDLYMLKEMFMRVNGQRIKPTDSGSILILMEVDMKDTGSKINNMVLV